MSDERRFRTDDSDLPIDEQRDLAIFFGGNGDWYVGVVPAGGKDMRNYVRVRTSGGADVTNPGLTTAIAAAYDAMRPDAREHARQRFDEEEELRALARELTEALKLAQFRLSEIGRYDFSSPRTIETADTALAHAREMGVIG